MKAKKEEQLSYDHLYLTILERVVRVEEELKYLREDMKHLREDMNHLRGDMNKRFSMMLWVMGIGFSSLFGLITLVLTNIL